MTPRWAETLVGTTLRGKWSLDALLGRGGMSAVYEATHRNGHRVAIKVLDPRMIDLPEVRQRFLREGYAANTLDHPAAVQVLDDDTTDDESTVFLVMELLQGETLEERIQRDGRLAPSYVVPIVDTLLEVLEVAHARGVLHRDLKPANVFLPWEGGVKLLDYGIARLKELGGGVGDTQNGMLLGTPAFMSPEQARGAWDEVDARTDLYAVGALLHASLTGEQVHEGATPLELVIKVATTPAASLVARGELPEALAAVVDRALAFERAERFESAAAMRAALRAAAADRGPAWEEGSSGRTNLTENPRAQIAALDAVLAGLTGSGERALDAPPTPSEPPGRATDPDPVAGRVASAPSAPPAQAVHRRHSSVAPPEEWDDVEITGPRPRPELDLGVRPTEPETPPAPPASPPESTLEPTPAARPWPVLVGVALVLLAALALAFGR
ncbi:MAG: protein kinase [Myxococcota bacterium]